MARSRYAALSLALGLLAGTGCLNSITGDGYCFHSEGCGNDGGLGSGVNSSIRFNGLVTARPGGQSLPGVTVRFEAPARGWSESVVTDSVGYYLTAGLPTPATGDCAGLSVTFSREGLKTLRVTDFGTLPCAPGYPHVNASLETNP